MRIRPLELQDRESVHELLQSTGTFASHEIDVAMELIDIALTQPDQQDYFPLVLENERKIAAYACFGKNPMTQSTYDLYWLATHTDCMRRGYGRELVIEIEQRICRLGGRLVVIETSSKELYAGSQRFYEKLGYALAASIPDFYSEGDSKLIYTKKLR